jgi:uncharacterized protein YjcR
MMRLEYKDGQVIKRTYAENKAYRTNRYTLRQLAEMLGVKKETIREYRRTGKIPANAFDFRGQPIKDKIDELIYQGYLQ